MDKTQKSVEVFDHFAQVYQERFMDQSLFHDSFDVFCAAIEKENAAVLELACGPGNITQYLIRKRPDFQILGTDLAPKMLELARQNNPIASFELRDCRDILGLNQKYDGVLCGFGLPYISKEDAIQLIRDSAKVLNSTGVLYLSTMEGDYQNSEWKPSSTDPEKKAFTHYHEAPYLIEALHQNGFEILLEDRKRYEDGRGDKVVDLILIGKLK